jgi:hypothetical protein
MLQQVPNGLNHFSPKSILLISENNRKDTDNKLGNVFDRNKLEAAVDRVES